MKITRNLHRPRDDYFVLSACFESISIAGFSKAVYYEIRKRKFDGRLTIHANIKSEDELGLKIEVELDPKYTPDSLKSLKYRIKKLLVRRIADLVDFRVNI
jgi:hypothetical protein